jgi:hypothetical protein
MRLLQVLQLIKAILALVNTDLDPATLRQHVLDVLAVMAEVAKTTPNMVDDRVIEVAIALVKSDAWTLIVAWLLAKEPPR